MATPSASPWVPLKSANKLDRVALAVESAESDFGRNPAMWRPDSDGPQGPMQISAAAATDIGGGDRFNADQNRALGRAYLARMYTRYGNWRDAVMAYNWGPGNLDQWIGAGRPSDLLNGAVAHYALKVLDGAGPDDGLPIAEAPPPVPTGPPPRPEVKEESIHDARLRQRVHVNNQEIAQLRAVLAVSVPGSTPGVLTAASYSDETLDWLKAQKIDTDQLAAGDAALARRISDAAASTVLALTQELSRRSNARNVGPPRTVKGSPDIGSIRVIAGVLLEQLLDDNDTLALIDNHQREERADGGRAKAEKRGQIRG